MQQQVNIISNRSYLGRITLIAFFAALTVIFSKIFIPLPFTPVPVTLQVAAVFLAGYLLEPFNAFITMLLYLLLGAVGLPVFSQGGGLAYLAGPTGGFLLSFPVAALVISLLTRRVGALASGIIGLILIYLGGTLHLAQVLDKGFTAAFLVAVVPFIPADIIKLVFAAGVYRLISSRLS